MNWKKEAENDLRNYSLTQDIIIRNCGLIDQIDQDMAAIRGASVDKISVRSGTSTREDWLVNNITKKQELELKIVIAKKQIELIHRGLLALSEEEQKILRFFYIDRPKNFIGRLCEELGYEQSSLYYHKDIALRKYTVAVYGMVDT